MARRRVSETENATPRKRAASRPAIPTNAPVAKHVDASRMLPGARAALRENMRPKRVIFEINRTGGLHPPTVAEGVKIAMDDAINAVATWANAAFGSIAAEGVTFLGYPFLAELAQRPEYRVMAETLAQEATREWIEFTGVDATDDVPQQEPRVIDGMLPSDRAEIAAKKISEKRASRIRELDAEFRRLNVQKIFAEVLTQDGWFGRGHIYLDTGDTDDPGELRTSLGDGWNATSIAKFAHKKIKALRTVEAVWCYPTNYDSNDPLKGNWYKPHEWYVQSKIVHSSRLFTIIARPVPDLLKPTYSFGGLSLSQIAMPYVTNWLETRQAVNDIIVSFSVFVLSTNLAASVQADGQEMLNRAELFNLVRSNKGLMMIDKETEAFQNVSASLAGLHELQAQAQEHMASVSHIPIVKLLGIQPAGLNASSEGEIRSFYDWIGSFQEFTMREPLHALVGLVMLSLWGEVDHSITFKFKPLWSLDEKGAAEVQKIKADTDAVLIEAGAITNAESRQRIADDANSGYDNIDASQVPNPPEDPGLEDMMLHGMNGIAADDATFKESEHPRDKTGKWTTGAGSSGGSSGGAGSSTGSSAATKNPISAGWLNEQLPGVQKTASNTAYTSYKSGDEGPDIWLSNTHSTWIANFKGKKYSGADIASLDKFLSTSEIDMDPADFDAGYGQGYGQGIDFVSFMKGNTKAGKKSAEAATKTAPAPAPEKKGDKVAGLAEAYGYTVSNAETGYGYTKGSSHLEIDGASGKWTLTSPGHNTKIGEGSDALYKLLTGSKWSKESWKAAGVKDYTTASPGEGYPEAKSSMQTSSAAATSQSSYQAPEYAVLRKELAKVRPKPTNEQHVAVNHYKGNGYAAINSNLRNGKTDSYAPEIHDWLAQAELPQDVTLYRAISGSYAEILRSSLDVGTIFRDRGFLSTTTNPGFAESWAEDLQLVITAKAGQRAAAIRDADAHDGEYEILIQDDSRLLVKSLDFENRRVEVELVQYDNASKQLKPKPVQAPQQQAPAPKPAATPAPATTMPQAGAPVTQKPVAPKPGSKKAQTHEMLTKEGGASVASISATLGISDTAAKALIADVKKLGHNVVKGKSNGMPVYHIPPLTS